MKPIIRIDNLTKDYGEGRGVFDVNINIGEGEMIGFVGTNGSGKTTTIRNIMGFLKPTHGAVYVNDLESWSNSSEIVKNIGYVPGEIAFPDLKTGIDFLQSQAEFLGVKSMNYANELVERLQLDPRAPLKRMSKGMKQKTAIVAALMADPKIIILDEPTTGLDPLMRDAFLEIIEAEHAKGKTIFMSSHMFGEMEKTCDKVALIRNGYVIDMANMQDIRNASHKEYKIELNSRDDYLRLKSSGLEIVRDQEKYNQLTIRVSKEDITRLIVELTHYDVKFMAEEKYTLERHFKEILAKEREKDVQ